MTCLYARNLDYTYQNRYKSVHAVKEAEISLERGKFYAIVGKSGSGKSTLLSLLAGLDIPTGGEILYEGISLCTLDMSEYRLNRASVIYQGFNLFPKLTALENVAFPLRLRKVPKADALARAASALDAVGLNRGFHRRYPSMMSGGEQQRVAIARALAQGSEILLADEPTGNLDSENSGVVVSILGRLAHEHNCCVVVVTHDDAIAQQADTVFRMADGRIKAE